MHSFSCSEDIIKIYVIFKSMKIVQKDFIVYFSEISVNFLLIRNSKSFLKTLSTTLRYMQRSGTDQPMEPTQVKDHL